MLCTIAVVSLLQAHPTPSSPNSSTSASRTHRKTLPPPALRGTRQAQELAPERASFQSRQPLPCGSTGVVLVQVSDADEAKAAAAAGASGVIELPLSRDKKNARSSAPPSDSSKHSSGPSIVTPSGQGVTRSASETGALFAERGPGGEAGSPRAWSPGTARCSAASLVASWTDDD